MQSVTGALPILYSFRRCPYAIRARMALLQAAIAVELREVDLKHKPQALLQASPNATVPVLDTRDGRVLLHSLDIMRWALVQNDAQQWLTRGDASFNQWLVDTNDDAFKLCLDRYKYAQHHPTGRPDDSRDEAARCLIAPLEACLARSAHVGGDGPCWADVAVFPFVRQFAAVDPTWWAAGPFRATRRWLTQWCASGLFAASMHKPAVWRQGDPALVFRQQPIFHHRAAAAVADLSSPAL